MAKLLKNELAIYLRDDQNNKIGVVLATGKNTIGWSLIHDEDTYINGGKKYFWWNDDKGFGTARSKAKKGFDFWEEYILSKVKVRIPTYQQGMPESEQLALKEFPKLYLVYSNLVKMKERATKYYK